jgi:hypothetical protein
LAFFVSIDARLRQVIRGDVDEVCLSLHDYHGSGSSQAPEEGGRQMIRARQKPLAELALNRRKSRVLRATALGQLQHDHLIERLAEVNLAILPRG